MQDRSTSRIAKEVIKKSKGLGNEGLRNKVKRQRRKKAREGREASTERKRHKDGRVAMAATNLGSRAENEFKTMSRVCVFVCACT